MGLRKFLSFRISVTQAILTLGAFVFTVSLAADGHLLAGLGVILLSFGATSLFALIQRRRLPARTERLEETALLPHTCEVVWALVKPADIAPALQPSVRLGYQVPGTPEGLGERQAFEILDGTTIVVEVIEYENNRRAVMRQVSPAVLNMRLVQAVDPVGEGCTYTEAVEVDLKPAHRIGPEFEETWRVETIGRIARIRAILDLPETTATSTGLSPAPN